MSDDNQAATADPEKNADVESQFQDLGSIIDEGDYIPKDESSDQSNQGKPEFQMDAGQAVSKLLYMLGQCLATRRGQHCALSEQEADMLGYATSDVLEKYVGKTQTSPEVVLLGAVAMVIGPRVLIDMQLQEEKSRAKPAAETAGKKAEAEASGDQTESSAA